MRITLTRLSKAATDGTDKNTLELFLDSSNRPVFRDETGTITYVATAPVSPGSSVIVQEPTAARTLTEADNGKVIICTNGTATVITVPAGLPEGFNCGVIRRGAGTVTFLNGGGAIESKGALLAIADMHTAASLVWNSPNTFTLTGNLG